MAGEDIPGFGRWTWPTRHRIGMISPSAAYQCPQSVPVPRIYSKSIKKAISYKATPQAPFFFLIINYSIFSIFLNDIYCFQVCVFSHDQIRTTNKFLEKAEGGHVADVTGQVPFPIPGAAAATKNFRRLA